MGCDLASSLAGIHRPPARSGHPGGCLPLSAPHHWWLQQQSILPAGHIAPSGRRPHRDPVSTRLHVVGANPPPLVAVMILSWSYTTCAAGHSCCAPACRRDILAPLAGRHCALAGWKSSGQCSITMVMCIISCCFCTAHSRHPRAAGRVPGHPALRVCELHRQQRARRRHGLHRGVLRHSQCAVSRPWQRN